MLERLSLRDSKRADQTERVELRALRADDTEFPAELTITATNVGGASLIIECIRDISVRKEAEGVLHESEARLRLAVEAAEIGLWDWTRSTMCSPVPIVPKPCLGSRLKRK